MMFDIFKMVHFNPQITGAFYPQIDTLLALRDQIPTEQSEAIESILLKASKAHPERLVEGLLHPDLQVRVRVSRMMNNQSEDLDPWADAAVREKQIAAFQASLKTSP